jgi:hypothetical protein
MSIPTTFFLDTSIFASQQYNFGSTALKTFVVAAQARDMIFLLPASTKQEIMRQINDRSKQALDALEDARKKAPFLAKWSGFPKNLPQDMSKWVVRRVAMEEWESFIKNFKYKELGYEHVDLKRVMKWYDSAMPPFNEGKKRKEFPDAFSIDALAAYARKENCYIGVVSQDHDFRDACERYSSLLYFPSLPTFTELLLSNDSRLELMKAAIQRDLKSICDDLWDLEDELSFVHSEDKYSDTEGNLKKIAIDSFSIVAIGDQECTITFDGTIEFSAELTWEVEKYSESEDDVDSVDVTDSVDDYSAISGTAKISFVPDYSKIDEVIYKEFDDTYIVVTEEP